MSRAFSRVLVLVLAAIGVATILIPSAGAAVGVPAPAEYAKNGKKAKKKAKKAKKKATKAIRDGQYVGVRGDGQEADWTLCKNGKYYLRTTNSYGTGISEGRGWKVSVAKQTKRGFWAIVNFGKSGYIALSKNGKQWKVGIESFDRPSQMGEAQRVNARKTCKTL